jgi:ABC-type transport system involved in multi-copper enzyme maturation permease subunit
MKLLSVALAIARNTFTELVRQKVFYFLLIFALLIIGNSAFMAKFSFQEQFQMLKDISLGAMSVFSSIIAILATANFLPKDIEDRTIYTILAKPVPRACYLLGKLGGIFALLAASVLLMSGLFLAVLWIREGHVIAETRAQLAAASPEELALAIKEVTSATFHINLVPGIVIIFIKSALLAALTLFLSTFATSSIFAILMATALYFIGHLQSTAREYWLSGVDVQWWSRVLVAVVSLVFPDLQAFNLTDDIIAGAAVQLTLFASTLGLGVLYIAVYFSLAALVFSGREL